MAVIKESEFKGNPVIVLLRNEDDHYPFTMGLSKARLVVEAMEQIRDWVRQQEAKQPINRDQMNLDGVPAEELAQSHGRA